MHKRGRGKDGLWILLSIDRYHSPCLRLRGESLVLAWADATLGLSSVIGAECDDIVSPMVHSWAHGFLPKFRVRALQDFLQVNAVVPTVERTGSGRG
jgi:hypothetical protein